MDPILLCFTSYDATARQLTREHASQSLHERRVEIIGREAAEALLKAEDDVGDVTAGIPGTGARGTGRGAGAGAGAGATPDDDDDGAYAEV